jgi:23S rRNA maturation-related 3'-5' exoribonuclease YhaM
MTRLPAISELTAGSSGWGFFLCLQKEVRPSRSGDLFVSLTLQDRTGLIPRASSDVDPRDEFGEGEFVKAQGRVDVYNGMPQLVVERIRRIDPTRTRRPGFARRLRPECGQAD